jgi:hypothetical protein
MQNDPYPAVDVEKRVSHADEEASQGKGRKGCTSEVKSIGS